MKDQKFTKLFFGVAILLPLLLAPTDTSAQFGFSAGPKAGLAVTSFRGADASDIEARTTWFYGIFTNFQLGTVVALQPELLLTERGADVTSNNVRSNISINYFEVPVLLKFRWPLANEVIFPHVLLGPNFAFRTDLDFTSTDTQSGGAVAVNTSDIRRSDIGGLVGAGVDIQTKGSGIFFTLDGRYGWSFQDLNDNDDMIALKHSAWTFAVGIGFRIGNASDEEDE